MTTPLAILRAIVDRIGGMWAAVDSRMASKYADMGRKDGEES